MIEHRGTLISEDLFEKRFVCDLNACKGACCEQGDSGAPITPEEAAAIKKHYEAIEPYMTARGKKAVEKQGVSVVDMDGELVTPLVDEYAGVRVREEGQARALEVRHRAGVPQGRDPGAQAAELPPLPDPRGEAEVPRRPELRRVGHLQTGVLLRREAGRAGVPLPEGSADRAPTVRSGTTSWRCIYQEWLKAARTQAHR